MKTAMKKVMMSLGVVLMASSIAGVAHAKNFNVMVNVEKKFKSIKVEQGNLITTCVKFAKPGWNNSRVTVESGKGDVKVIYYKKTECPKGQAFKTSRWGAPNAKSNLKNYWLE